MTDDELEAAYNAPDDWLTEMRESFAEMAFEYECLQGQPLTAEEAHEALLRSDAQQASHHRRPTPSHSPSDRSPRAPLCGPRAAVEAPTRVGDRLHVHSAWRPPAPSRMWTALGSCGTVAVSPLM